VATLGLGVCAGCTHGGGGTDTDENDTLIPPKKKSSPSTHTPLPSPATPLWKN